MSRETLDPLIKNLFVSASFENPRYKNLNSQIFPFFKNFDFPLYCH